MTECNHNVTDACPLLSRSSLNNHRFYCN